MTEVRDADCCYFCKHRYILYGHFSDAVECNRRGQETVRYVEVCDLFEKRDKE